MAQLLVQIGEGGLEQLAMAWILSLIALLPDTLSGQTKVLTLSAACGGFGGEFHSRLRRFFSRLRLLSLDGFALPTTCHSPIIGRSLCQPQKSGLEDSAPGRLLYRLTPGLQSKASRY